MNDQLLLDKLVDSFRLIAQLAGAMDKLAKRTIELEARIARNEAATIIAKAKA